MEPEKKPNGAFVGLAVIIIILVVGGIYIWNSNKIRESPMEQQTVTNEDSAELNALEQEIENTDPNAGVNAGTIY